MTESNREITWKTASSMEDVEVETKNAKTYRQMRNCKLGENVYDDTKKSGLIYEICSLQNLVLQKNAKISWIIKIGSQC